MIYALPQGLPILHTLQSNNAPIHKHARLKFKDSVHHNSVLVS